MGWEENNSLAPGRWRSNETAGIAGLRLDLDILSPEPVPR